MRIAVKRTDVGDNGNQLWHLIFQYICTKALLHARNDVVWKVERRSMEQASSRGPPGTGRHHAEEPVIRARTALAVRTRPHGLPPAVLCAPLERGALRSGRSAHHCAPLSFHALALASRARTNRAAGRGSFDRGAVNLVQPGPSLFLSPSLSPRPRRVATATRYRR